MNKNPIKAAIENVASSTDEEKISALWLIAGLLAWNDGIYWLAWCLFVKSALDVVCIVIASIKEMK